MRAKKTVWTIMIILLLIFLFIIYHKVVVSERHYGCYTPCVLLNMKFGNATITTECVKICNEYKFDWWLKGQ